MNQVDFNDTSSSCSNSSSSHDDDDDRRAKTPTPHGRRKKMKKKKVLARNRSGSSSASSSSASDDDSVDGKKEKKESIKEEKVARFSTSGPILRKAPSDEEKESEKQDTKNNEPVQEIKKQNDDEEKKKGNLAAEMSSGRRVSVSSSSSSSSFPSSSDEKEKKRGKGSSDDYSDSKKEDEKAKIKTATNKPKIVDMGEEEDMNDERILMENQRPVSVMEVGAAPAMAVAQVVQQEEQKKEEQSEREQEPELEKKGHNEDDAASVASSSSSSPSPSSSSGSATIHDKGPNTVNDPTVTLDDEWREQSGSASKEEAEAQEKKIEEEKVPVVQREPPRVQIIREDLTKKPESDSSSSSSSDSDSDLSHSEGEPNAGKKTTTWQAHADVHQNESQPESDPEATHGGNDPDNVANGSDVNGSKSFEPAVPAKAKPGSVLTLLEASQTTLEMKGVTLNKSQVYEVAEFLEHKAGINSINLVNCGIDDDDVQKLTEAIQQSPSNPMMLNLGLNPLTVDSVHHILTACKHKPTIEAVLLQGTRLGDDGVNALIAGMKAQMEDRKMRGQSTDKGIHELDLSDCKFGDQGALGVARLLTSTLDVDTLTLTHNHAISSDGWKCIGDALKLNTHLETLTLDHNYIGDQGMEHIAQGLFDNTSVTALDINDVGVTDRGGKSIMELLKRNTYLLEITVMENKLSDEVSENIQKYISLNKASFSPK